MRALTLLASRIAQQSHDQWLPGYPKPEPVRRQHPPHYPTDPRLFTTDSVFPGAECKRHKIRCEFRPGESNCTKCIRSGIKCMVNDFSQKFVDDDGVYVSRRTPASLPPCAGDRNR
jgi:hypothetical protein